MDLEGVNQLGVETQEMQVLKQEGEELLLLGEVSCQTGEEDLQEGGEATPTQLFGICALAGEATLTNKMSRRNIVAPSSPRSLIRLV